MPPLAKLLTSLAATALIARLAWALAAPAVLAHLGGAVAGVMLSHGVADGSVRWQNPAGWTFRTARLSGSADAATRAAVLAEVRHLPGIHDAIWQQR